MGIERASGRASQGFPLWAQRPCVKLCASFQSRVLAGRGGTSASTHQERIPRVNAAKSVSSSCAVYFCHGRCTECSTCSTMAAILSDSPTVAPSPVNRSNGPAVVFAANAESTAGALCLGAREPFLSLPTPSHHRIISPYYTAQPGITTLRTGCDKPTHNARP